MVCSVIFLVLLGSRAIIGTHAAGNDGAVIMPEMWSDCSDGWYSFKDSCYKWFGSERKETWFQAEMECQNEGGHLLSISSEEETRLIRGITLCQNEYWIGLVNTDYVGNRFLSKEGWKWWDTSVHEYSRMSYTNTAGLDCGYAKIDGNWANYYCSHRKHGWVCKKPVDYGLNAEKMSSPIRPRRLCSPGWVFYNKFCYLFSNSTANYFHAQLQCEEHESEVVTIHSEQEQGFLQAMNGCNEAFWIGLEMARPCLDDKNNKGCWKWTDLSPVKYVNWKSNNPSATDFECTLSKGYWENSQPCKNMNRFVCKKGADFGGP